MFDVNLLNDSGIQKEKNSRIEKKSIDFPKEEIHEKINSVKEPTEWKKNFMGILSLCLVLFIILFTNRENKIEVDNSNFSISYLLNMLYDGHDKIQLNSINHNNENINIIIEVRTEEKLYEKLDFFRNVLERIIVDNPGSGYSNRKVLVNSNTYPSTSYFARDTIKTGIKNIAKDE